MLKTTASRLTSIAFVTGVLLPWHATAQTPAAGSPPARPTVPATTATTPSRTAARTTAARWTDQDYHLGAGDKLRVEVYKQDQFSQSLQIRPDGKITLTLI